MDLNFHKENEILRSLIDQLANNPELQDWAKGLTDEERDFYGRENVPNNIAEHIVLLSIIEQITLQEALQMAKRNVAIAVERKKLIESLTEIMETTETMVITETTVATTEERKTTITDR